MSVRCDWKLKDFKLYNLFSLLRVLLANNLNNYIILLNRLLESLPVLGKSSLVFAEILHSNSNLETRKSDRCKFCKKFFCPKTGKNCPKWSFQRTLILLFAGNNLKWKYYKSLLSLQTSYLGLFLFTSYKLKTLWK